MRGFKAKFVEIDGQSIEGLYIDSYSDGRVRGYYYLDQGKRVSCTSNLTVALERFFRRDKKVKHITLDEIWTVFAQKELCQQYKRDAKFCYNQFRDVVGKTKLNDITFDDISRYGFTINILSQERTRPDLYINHRVAYMRSIFNFAANKFEDRQQIERILAYLKQLDLVKQKRPMPKILSKEDFKKVYEHDELMRLYLLLGLNCAYTWIEINELKREDIDHKNKTILKRRHKTDVLMACQLWDETYELLQKHLTALPSKTTMRVYWSNVCKSLGLKINHKILRSSVKTVATIANVNADLIKIVMGHTNGIADHYLVRGAELTKPVTDAVREYYF